MKLAQHHIRKQFLDFDFTTKSAALQWQQKVPFQYQQEYVKKIEAVLDKYDDGSCIEIDKIVIDIGIVREDEVHFRLAEELDIVLKKIRGTDVIPKESSIIQSSPITSEEVLAETKKEELLQAFLYFIKQGHFPWHIKIPSISKLEEQLVEQFLMSDLIASLKTNKVLDQRWEKMRFFNQFSNSFVQEITRLYFKAEYSSLSYIAKFCDAQIKKPFFKPHFTSKEKSKITDDLTRWILLFASDNVETWSMDYAKWYVTQNCVSEIFTSDEKVWNTLKDLKPDDNNKVTAEYIKELFAAIKVVVKSESKKFDSTDEKENNDVDHLPSETDISKNEVAKIEENVITFKGKKNEDEVSQVVEENSREIDAQVSKNKADSDNLSVFDEMDTELLSKEGKANDSDNESELPDIVDKNREQEDLSDISKNTQELNISEESIERQLSNTDIVDEKNSIESFDNDTAEENSSTEPSDDSFSSHATFEDSDNQVLFNDVKQAEFYPTVEETIDSILPPEKDLGKTEKQTSALPPDSYYINDGGLVLVWPYLSRLFENLKYTKELQFISKEQQERAVLLLGYIATGKSTCGEHELVFSKFLCNWPFQMPVIHPFEISDLEKEEVKSMLTGLIAHWSILKNTSIEGLRETFFWREGKLVEKEDFWKLVIEQKGTDILLDHLPYGISMIKLPWHKKMLRVDWA